MYTCEYCGSYVEDACVFCVTEDFIDQLPTDEHDGEAKAETTANEGCIQCVARKEINSIQDKIDNVFSNDMGDLSANTTYEMQETFNAAAKATNTLECNHFQLPK